MSSARLPVRLERPPLVEAVFEIRFGGGKLFASELLPGLLYGRFSSSFEAAEPLPIASLPRELRDADPNLRYQPTVRLSGPDGALLIGDHVFSVSKSPPYRGWEHFRQWIVDVLTVVHTTGILTNLERYSFKCVNVIAAHNALPMSVLDIGFRLGRYEVAARGFRLRSEVDAPPFTTVVEVGSHARVASPTQTREGVLVSLDTINSAIDNEFWVAVAQNVDAAHAELKTTFFSLLTDDTLNSLGPVWE